MNSKNTDQVTPVLIDALIQINKLVISKKQVKNNKSVERKFIEQSDFNDIVNKIKFNNLRSDLETTHLSYVIGKFYSTVQDAISVNDKSSTLDNIYFNTNKKLHIMRSMVIMTTVTIVLIWLNYTISNVELYRFLHIDIDPKIESKKEIIDTLRPQSADPTLEEQAKNKIDSAIKTADYELQLLYREKRNRSMNWLIRIIIPFFFMVFLIALMFGSLKKSVATHNFNMDLIETNTFSLKNSIEDLDNKLNFVDKLLTAGDKQKKIGDIVSISQPQKTEIFNNIKTILDKYEKCNFIIEAQKNKLPFPYSEIATSGFMLGVTILCFLYIYIQLKPISRLKQIKELNKMWEEAIIADQVKIKSMKKELEYILTCHNDDLETVLFTLKIVFFIFIVTFLIFYSTKVINSASEYQAGLYNSGYFETGNCVS
jgi:uncharacterized membrane protein YciS (DUF1049 family)